MIVRILLACTLAAAGVIAASPVAAGGPTITDPFDHLTCFKIRDGSRFKAIVDLEVLAAGLELEPGCRVGGRGRLYCSPTRKSVTSLSYPSDSTVSPIEMPGRDRSEDRICYRLRCPADPLGAVLEVQDQFGRRRIEEPKAKLLCTNARVGPDETTTTTAPKSTTTTTLEMQDPCALIDCAPGHFCRPTCDAPGQAECVPFAEEGESCGGFVPFCSIEICASGLECRVPPFIPDAPGVCVPEGSGGCTSDADCPPGSVCVDAGSTDPDGRVCVAGCRTDADCPSGQQCVPTPCPGPPCADQCVERVGCSNDEECGPGRVCEPGGPNDPLANVCVVGCHDDADCNPEQICVEVVCVTTPCPGQCEGGSIACESHADCPVDQLCMGGVCVPPGTCGECTSDADCGPGSVCNAASVCLLSCECPECDVCAGTCVPPVPCGECVTDHECPAGQRCTASEVCMVSCDCPLCAVCAGNCEP